ncbi:hypothetical protein MRS76_01905 [Rhizobiaceae bacterium n13]|uniref:Anti-sigma factor NepR domain-containing protein n=1 Tax=Ferirhizobium litorale TaxID=2927786 RepID=A0AAE3U0R5_9HYPH|nr:NepR family anti-sigma factor [Fererhizobium litorale]MDI7860699.1 hypothetical protein [Fererhizobium litorale]MDI7920847.1 hypothetical protein [Fererhizobium litorale]
MSDTHREVRGIQRSKARSASIADPNNQIGIKLRSLYAAAQEEAIPDRFLDLLEKLDQAERAATASKKGE